MLPLDVSRLDPKLQLIDLSRADCEDSLYVFLQQSWHVFDSDPWVDGWCVEAIAEHLQAVIDGQIRRLCINIPPRCSKTALCAVALPGWTWAQQRISHTSGPGVKFLYASYREDLSRDSSVACRNVIESNWYQQRWGERFALATDQNTKGRFDNNKGGYRMITSVESKGSTGFGASIIVLDDCNSAKEIESEAVIESTIEWYDGTLGTRLNNQKLGAVIQIQQRVGERDLTGHIMEKNKGEWDFLILPMRFETWRKSHVTSIGWSDPRTEEGQLLWPERFDDEVVTGLENWLLPWRCTPGESPILMTDLSMKPIREIRVGDEIIGFSKRAQVVGDASYARRMLTKTTVLEIHSFVAPVVKITLDSGEVIRCTPDHKWFTRRRGETREAYHPAKLGSHLARVCPPRLPKLTTEEERDAGWLAGFFDGEGSVCQGAYKSHFIQQRERVVKIEDDGEDTVYGLTTETGNYIVWGLASSNSAGQLQQRPAPKGGGIIERDWWRLWEPNTYPVFDFVLATLDTAYTEDQMNDPSGMIIWGVFSEPAPDGPSRVIGSDQRALPKQIHPSDGRAVPKAFMMFAWEKYLKLHDLVMQVATDCTKFKVDLLLIENKASGISVSQELHRLFGQSRFGVQMFDPKSQDKVARLNSVAPLFYEGLVYAPSERFKWVEPVIGQAERFPKARHDDLVDCISMGIKHLRDAGLICRVVEREAEIEDMTRYRSREQPLYPA